MTSNMMMLLVCVWRQSINPCGVYMGITLRVIGQLRSSGGVAGVCAGVCAGGVVDADGGLRWWSPRW